MDYDVSEILKFDEDPIRSFPRTTSEKPFYMVYGGIGSDVPKKVHYTFIEALSECQRLSELNPGKRYFVLQSVTISQIEIPPVKTERLVE